MICSLCNGEVTWRGPLSDLTHSECCDCGGRNCQISEVYEPEPDSLQGDGAETP